MSGLPRVVYAGTPEFAVPALTALLRAGYPVVGVLTRPDRPSGRGRRLTASPVRRAALDAGLPVSQPERLDAAALDDVRAWAPDVVVVVAYGQLLPSRLLALPPLGCINVHASLLPRWRGAAPIQRALLAGDEVTGVSVMAMVQELDAGPVYLSRALAIGDQETAGELHDRLAALGADALLDALPDVAAARLEPRAQDPSAVTYAAKLSKAEATLRWHQPAVALALQVRAFNPWPVAETRLGDERVRIWRARPVAATAVAEPGTVTAAGGDELRVATGDGELQVLALQWPGGRVVSARDALSGRALAGERFG